MELDKSVRCFEQAAAILPTRLRRAAESLTQPEKAQAEEIRLRAGQELSVLLSGRELPLHVRVEQTDLETVCDLATEFSRYAAAETLCSGYLPVRGGCRLGLCGTAVIKNGANTSLRDFSSVCIRIAREKPGIAEGIAPQLFQEERYCSTLILSPPGGGKTTLLRDLIRCLSAGVGLSQPQRVCLADERGEVAVVFQGEPQMDVGPRTDVLEGCPKALAIPMLLRCMNPQIIAVDEVTAAEDLRAMTQAANCGVGLLATIHGGSVAELAQKPLYAELLAAHVFSLAVLIEHSAGERHYRVEELPC
ncbi:MAG: Flp pilus assembly complex ATPase component TadA [Oscillibacter sp.]|jgi:stage III sporulation protein AA|nr:Flp pilus assembly complex ATPase component TadA [Oscillibacter sp.]